MTFVRTLLKPLALKPKLWLSVFYQSLPQNWVWLACLALLMVSLMQVFLPEQALELFSQNSFQASDYGPLNWGNSDMVIETNGSLG